MNPSSAGGPRHWSAAYFETDCVAASKAYIVEDNPLIRDNLMETLTELVGIQTVGYSATESEACSWLEQHPQDWQLLIVDLFLLEGTGLGVLKKCSRQRSGRQRMVVLSNYTNADVRSRCLACGADAVFDKSTELDQFLAFCACLR